MDTDRQCVLVQVVLFPRTALSSPVPRGPGRKEGIVGDEGLTHRGGRPAVEVVAVSLWGDGGRVHDSGREVQDEGTAVKAQTLGRHGAGV